MTRRVAVIIVAVVLLGGLIGYSKFRRNPRKVSGFIEADEIRLGSRIGGRVAEVLTEEGETVRAGQILVRLEPYDLLQREQEAEASLAALEAKYQQLKAGLRQEEQLQAKARHDQAMAKLERAEAGPRKQEIEAGRGRLDVAQAELVVARENHSRVLGLVQSNAATRKEMDQAIHRQDAAGAMVVVRQQELALLEAGTRVEEIREAKARVDEAWQAFQLARKGYREEEIEGAKAARNAALAAVEVIGEQKKELLIRSPIDGVVEAMELQKGDLVAAGAPVLSILDEGRLWVRAYVPQTYLDLQVSEKLEVTIDSFPEERFVGEVSFISRQAEFTPSNVQTPEERLKQVFRIKVALDNKARRFRPGMSVDVWLADRDGKSAK